MRMKLMLALLAALALLVAAGCPRNPEGENAELPEAQSPPAAVLETPSQAAPPAETPAEAGTTGEATPIEGDAAAALPEGVEVKTVEAQAAETPVAPTGDTVVIFETTKGTIEITVHPDWAPIGAEHFLKLVNAKFYDGAPWFRVIDGFVAQCGVSADPKLNQEWGEKTIMDEPLKQGNKPGTVCFGKSGLPNSRSTHIFINLADNSAGLDRQGFSCFAEVTKGMEVAQQLTRCEYHDQGSLGREGGLDAFKSMFPQADFITKAYVKK